MGKRKQFISLAMTAALVLSSLPMSALAVEEDNSSSVFVTMNIPYNTFYQADITNETEVDAVTSATSSKWKTFAGTYYSAAEEGEGGKILGVSFPVEVSKEDYSKLKALDSETADYYFKELQETPAVYKTLTVDEDGNYNFSEVKGTAATVEDSKYTLTSETVWGDYLFEFSDVTIDGTVYGIIVKTESGKEYGMRHLENIWKKTYEFAWGSGIKTTEPHGNTFSPAHYESIMGETIKEVTYITDKSITTYNVNAYVPVKTASVVTVESAKITDASTKAAINPALPEDYNAAYSVEGLDVQYADGTLSYAGAKAGNYTLRVTDTNGKYADLTASFTLSTDTQPAKYDSESKSLAAAEDITEDEFKSYLKNISSVEVDGAAYAASGKRSVIIIDPETGKIDLTAANKDTPVFDTENKKTFSVKVTAAGYPELSFEISLEDKIQGIVGDVDGNEKINSTDSLLILRASVNLENFTDGQIKLADINRNGKIDSEDSLLVLRASVQIFDDANKNVGQKATAE